MTDIPAYFRYWGKAKPSTEEGPQYHLLPYHSLDVAAVADLWWNQSPAIRRSFMQYSGNLSTTQMKAWVIFFIALHDYGKFDIRFQRKAIPVWETLQVDTEKTNTLPTVDACKTYDHGSAGLYWFNEDREDTKKSEILDWASQLADLIEDSNDDSTAWLAWIRQVTGHHGFVHGNNLPVPNHNFSITVDKSFPKQDQIARRAWLSKLEKLFLQPAGLSLTNTPPEPSPLLAGFCSIADWLGSRSDETNFSYVAEPIHDLQDYFDKKLHQDAARVLALAGVATKTKPFEGMQALLKHGFKPRQLQTLVNELPLSAGLTIVEAPTGSGKTEMAIAYAWRLLSENIADSIIVAMPTQATANAMLLRLKKLAKTLFDNNPNLILAHGNARFNEAFINLKQAGDTAQGDEEAWAQCNEWLGQSRKRIFLGQIGICTIDQALVSVLPVKHRFVRGFGLGRSILIVDEVHAYDAYMYGLLTAVLKAQHQAGSSSILLSATLNSKLRNDLLKTYRKTPETEKSSLPYPLISWADEQIIQAFILPKDELPPEREVQLEHYSSENLLPNVELYQRIINAAENGAKITIICNLVDIAQYLVQVFQERASVPVDIFHARYCLHDRQKKENAVLENFGSESKRASGRILVATQVIEQSLDVDFDWIITQLCPVDLLFQRMGRLHRHDRTRPTGLESPLCTVLLPNGTDFGAHGLIYANTRVMWRTSQKLQHCPNNKLKFPHAYRDWIEDIYAEDAWGTEPEEIEAGYAEFENTIFNKRTLAGQMLKWANNKALQDSDEKIRAVTRDGEFNLAVVPYLQTSSGKLLLDGSVFEAKAERQQLEALAMNTVGVPKSWGKYLPAADDEERIWLAMQADGAFWEAQCKDMIISYHPELGMEKKA